MKIYSHEDLKIWHQEDAVGWIDFKYSIPVEMYVEPYESLGEHPTEGGIEWILPLFDNEGWSSWIDQT